MVEKKVPAIQTYGKKKNATAIAYCKKGKGLIKINGFPLDLVQPEILRVKAKEPVLVLGEGRFKDLDIRIRVSGGGIVSQVYACRQALAKAVVAYNQKYIDEATKMEIRAQLMSYDRTLLVADPRKCEPKKFGGVGARSRYQKSYR